MYYYGMVISYVFFIRYIGASFNGRTTDSDSVNVGSIPTAPAKSLYKKDGKAFY